MRNIERLLGVIRIDFFKKYGLKCIYYFNNLGFTFLDFNVNEQRNIYHCINFLSLL